MKTGGGGLPGLRGFSAVFNVRCSLTIHLVEREYTTHTNTTPQHAASQACLLHDGDVLRVLSACFCCLPLGVGSKASGWKRGRQGRRRRRQGAGGSAMPRCVPMFVRGGRCTPRIRPGGGEESEGDGGGRDRGSGGAQGWWRPPRAGCSRRGEVAGGRDRCALLECARQSSSGCSHGDLRARGRQGSRRSPCSPGAQSRWGVGGRERAARPAYR